MGKAQYDEILFSGRAVFFSEGLDFYDVDTFKSQWFKAARRRGLRLATRTCLDPPGIVLRAYHPGHQRPELPLPSGASAPKKSSKPHLFCIEDECENRISAQQQLKNRRCNEH